MDVLLAFLRGRRGLWAHPVALAADWHAGGSQRRRVLCPVLLGVYSRSDTRWSGATPPAGARSEREEVDDGSRSRTGRVGGHPGESHSAPCAAGWAAGGGRGGERQRLASTAGGVSAAAAGWTGLRPAAGRQRVGPAADAG